jgi:hypothetical protein
LAVRDVQHLPRLAVRVQKIRAGPLVAVAAIVDEKGVIPEL